jgi:hypothetical protein
MTIYPGAWSLGRWFDLLFGEKTGLLVAAFGIRLPLFCPVFSLFGVFTLSTVAGVGFLLSAVCCLPSAIWMFLIWSLLVWGALIMGVRTKERRTETNKRKNGWMDGELGLH